jgi:hypothetical protein
MATLCSYAAWKTGAACRTFAPRDLEMALMDGRLIASQP